MSVRRSVGATLLLAGVLLPGHRVPGNDAPLALADLEAYRVALAAKPDDSAPTVGFRDLWERPSTYSGKAVSVEGRLARLFRQPGVGEFPPLAEAWVVTPSGDPFCLVFPLPEGRPSPEVGAQARFSGTFLKRVEYKGGDAPRLAPLIVGPLEADDDVFGPGRRGDGLDHGRLADGRGGLRGGRLGPGEAAPDPPRQGGPAARSAPIVRRRRARWARSVPMNAEVTRGDAEPDPQPHSEAASTATRLRRSPLTDPRALVLSLVIHAILLATASILALRVAAPRAEATGGPMQGELEGVDNRARAADAGGTGEPEGRAADLSAEPGIPAPPTRDPAADALISEILPTRDSAETTAQTLPGPSTSGLGTLNGMGSGEGAGQGGGPAGGGPKGSGPGTEFFGTRDRGSSFAYVIDCSGSMTARGSLDVAKGELLASLGRLSADARFAVVFYNLDAKVFSDPTGRPGLMEATPSNKGRVRTLLSGVQADGGTDHMLALRTAFALRPEVIFFLTDADLMTRQDVAELVGQAGKTRIQAVEFGQVTGLGGSAPLKQLAKQTGGTYRYIDVNSFSR